MAKHAPDTKSLKSAPAPAEKSSGDANEGEGNVTAARRYDSAVQATVASGKVEASAEAARKALDGPEGASLRKAEADGKKKAKRAR